MHAHTHTGMGLHSNKRISIAYKIQMSQQKISAVTGTLTLAHVGAGWLFSVGPGAHKTKRKQLPSCHTLEHWATT